MAEKQPIAWQPLTPRGIAAFAGAGPGRLLVVQVVFALASALVVAWLVWRCWYPVVEEAIRHLPPAAAIVGGELVWPGDSPARLAEGRFLAIAVDPDHGGSTRTAAHVGIEFGTNELRVLSLAGFVQAKYPAGLRVNLARDAVGPWWGAWSAPILWMTALAVTAGLMASWALLASLYCWPLMVAGYFMDRDLSLRGSWLLAGAALMPGAVWMMGGLIIYGFRGLDLVQLAVGTGLHFVVGLIYAVLGLRALPAHPMAPPKGNPFVGGKS